MPSTDVFLFGNAPYAAVDVILRATGAADAVGSRPAAITPLALRRIRGAARVEGIVLVHVSGGIFLLEMILAPISGRRELLSSFRTRIWGCWRGLGQIRRRLVGKAGLESRISRWGRPEPDEDEVAVTLLEMLEQ